MCTAGTNYGQQDAKRRPPTPLQNKVPGAASEEPGDKTGC